MMARPDQRRIAQAAPLISQLTGKSPPPARAKWKRSGTLERAGTGTPDRHV